MRSMRIDNIIADFFLEITGKHSGRLAVILVSDGHFLESVYGKNPDLVSSMPVK